MKDILKKRLKEAKETGPSEAEVKIMEEKALFVKEHGATLDKYIEGLINEAIDIEHMDWLMIRRDDLTERFDVGVVGVLSYLEEESKWKGIYQKKIEDWMSSGDLLHFSWD